MEGGLKDGVQYQESYQQMELLGQGGFGKVYRVECQASQASLAAKHLPATRRKQRDAALAEVQLLSSLGSNEFIIRFVAAFDLGPAIVLVMELLEGGELFERCADEDVTLTEEDCCGFVRQVCRGMQYLHSNSVVHLDLKPENIVITAPGGRRVKVIDFGTAVRLQPGERVQAMVGTAEFVAPEVVNYDDITTETDQWSLGVVCYILLSGYSPFLDEDEDQQTTLSNVSKAKYDFDYPEYDAVSAEAKDFISRLLRKQAQHRITSADCLEHPWLSETPRSNVIRVEQLRRFLARRKLHNVGRVLRAINVLRKVSQEAARQRQASSSSDEEQIRQ